MRLTPKEPDEPPPHRKEGASETSDRVKQALRQAAKGLQDGRVSEFRKQSDRGHESEGTSAEDADILPAFRDHYRDFKSAVAAGDKPALVVLDLDFTFWPCDAALAKYAEPITTTGSTAKTGELRTTGGCITPFYQALKIVKHLRKVSNLGRPWPIAIASANRQSDRCRRLLKQMGLVKIPEEYGGIVPKLMVVHPMTTGTKKEHFERIRKESGVSYDQMVFFDDVESNVESVQELGVTCGLVNSSTGLTFQAFVEALERWRNRRKPAPETPFKPLAPKPKVPAVPKVEKEKKESSQGQASDKKPKGRQRPVTPPRGPPKKGRLEGHQRVLYRLPPAQSCKVGRQKRLSRKLSRPSQGSHLNLPES